MENMMCAKGKYINIGDEGFRSIRNSEYVDKSELIGFINSCQIGRAHV